MTPIGTALKDKLADWTDHDIACHELAIALSILPDTAKFSDHKATYWTRNPIGDFLTSVLMNMVDHDILEEKTDDVQYRWKQ